MNASDASPTVYVVIPVHDRCGLTRECLLSLGLQSYPKVTTVVVDDGSIDQTAQMIARDFPDVVVLPGDGDLWWTGATNVGVSWVLDRCSPQDYVLTLNNDTTVDSDYILVLVTIAQKACETLVGSVAVDAVDRSTIVDGGPRVKWMTARMWSEHVGGSLADCLERGIHCSMPDMLPGRGTLIPVECFQRIGLYEAERLPHYSADYEFAVRAARAGYRLLMSYDAPVFSVVQATGVSTRRGRIPWRAFFGMFISRRSPACLIYRWRYARLAAPLPLVPIYLMADTIRVLGGALRDQLLGGRV